MNLSGLRTRLAHLASRTPGQAREPASTGAACDLLIAEGAVMAKLEEWYAKRADYEPLPPPTILHKPDAADLKMAGQCSALRVLAETRLIHAADVLDGRFEKLYRLYNVSPPDEAVEAALEDADARLTNLAQGTERVPSWCVSKLALLRNDVPKPDPKTMKGSRS